MSATVTVPPSYSASTVSRTSLNGGAVLRDLHERIDADEVAARERQAQYGKQRRELS